MSYNYRHAAEDWKRTVELLKVDIFDDFRLFLEQFVCDECGEHDILSSDGGSFIDLFRFSCGSCSQRYLNSGASKGDKRRTSLPAYTRFFKAHLQKLTTPCATCPRKKLSLSPKKICGKEAKPKKASQLAWALYRCEYPGCEVGGKDICEVCQANHHHGDSKSQAKLQNHGALWAWRDLPLPSKQTADCHVCREAKSCKLCGSTDHFDHSCEPDKDWVRSSISQIVSGHIKIIDHLFDINTQPAAISELMDTQPEEEELAYFGPERCSNIKDHSKYIIDLRRVVNHLKLFLHIREPIFCEYIEVFRRLYVHLQEEVHKRTLPDEPEAKKAGWPLKKIIIGSFLPFTEDDVDSKYIYDEPENDSVYHCTYESFEHIVSAPCKSAKSLIPVAQRGGISYSWLTEEGEIYWYPQREALDTFAKKYLGEEKGFWDRVRLELAGFGLHALHELTPNCWVAANQHKLYLIIVEAIGRILRKQILATGQFANALDVKHRGVNDCAVYVLSEQTLDTHNYRPVIMYLELKPKNGFPAYGMIHLETDNVFSYQDTMTSYVKHDNEMIFCICRAATTNTCGFFEEFARIKEYSEDELGKHRFGCVHVRTVTFYDLKILSGSHTGMCLLAHVHAFTAAPPRLMYAAMPALVNRESATHACLRELHLPLSDLQGDFIDAYLRTSGEPDVWQLVTLFQDKRRKLASVYVFSIPEIDYST